MDWNVLIGILIPFAGTTLGAAMVFFLRNEMNERLQKALLGFASGVMIAASIWSLLIPAIEMSGEQDCVAWFPATVGFLAGMGFLLILDMLTPHMYWINEELGGMKDGFKKTTMLVLAVTLHNVPEGMAVGVTFAGVMSGSALMSMAGAFVLAIGIAVQNFPEGAIISLPLRGDGVSRKKAFLYGMASGIVEPIAALITIALTQLIVPILPYLLAFAAGAMIYVVVEELVPEAQCGKHTNLATIGVALGFILMMILDVALG
ncbi:MAG: ZIP family metal transporter [Ruminococcus sp.]|nr:ZIP family metal transporter [Ruminococcus sp.]